MFNKSNKLPDISTSYRPIKLPYFLKISQRLIFKRISLHICSNNILPPTQFEFSITHSTINQVHRVIDAISTSLKQKLYCTVAFMNISQAFVWHKIATSNYVIDL